jgi:hypothetical protein
VAGLPDEAIVGSRSTHVGGGPAPAFWAGARVAYLVVRFRYPARYAATTVTFAAAPETFDQVPFTVFAPAVDSIR